PAMKWKTGSCALTAKPGKQAEVDTLAGEIQQDTAKLKDAEKKAKENPPKEMGLTNGGPSVKIKNPKPKKKAPPNSTAKDIAMKRRSLRTKLKKLASMLDSVPCGIPKGKGHAFTQKELECLYDCIKNGRRLLLPKNSSFTLRGGTY